MNDIEDRGVFERKHWFYVTLTEPTAAEGTETHQVPSRAMCEVMAEPWREPENRGWLIEEVEVSWWCDHPDIDPTSKDHPPHEQKYSATFDTASGHYAAGDAGELLEFRETLRKRIRAEREQYEAAKREPVSGGL